MSKMTITHDALADKAKHYGLPELAAANFVAALGITVAPAEPPETMVKLAREIAATLYPGDEAVITSGQWDTGAGVKAALAALQHAVDVVKEHDNAGYPGLIERATILTALGAGGRDAG